MSVYTHGGTPAPQERGTSAGRVPPAQPQSESRSASDGSRLRETRAGTSASHRAAARLHGLDGSRRTPIEVVTRQGRFARIEGVITHRWANLDEGDLTTVDGISCTTIAVTLAHLGAVVSIDLLDAALESALREGVSERWIRDTVTRLHRPGPSGTGALIRLLDDPNRNSDITESELERLVDRAVTAHGLPYPQLQHRVLGVDGQPYRMDPAWPNAMLGLEGHSRRFHFGAKKEAADHARDLAISAVGWDIQYVTRWQLNQPDEFLRNLAALYHRRLELVAA